MTKRMGAQAASRNRWARAIHLMVAALLAAGGTVVLSAPPPRRTLSGLPPGFIDELVVGGLPFPTAVAFSPDDRMLVALKRGEVRLTRTASCSARSSTSLACARQPRPRAPRPRRAPGLPEHALRLPALHPRSAGRLPRQRSTRAARPNPCRPACRSSCASRPTRPPATRARSAGTERGAPRDEQHAREHRGGERRPQHGRRLVHVAAKTMSGDARRGLHPVGRELAHDRHRRLRAGRLALRRERRRLELRRRRPPGAPRAAPRQPRREDPADRPDHAARACRTTRSSTPPTRTATARRSGRTACATRSASRSEPATSAPFIGDVGWNSWEEIDDREGRELRLALLRGRRRAVGLRGRRRRRACARARTRRARSRARRCQALYAQGLGAVKAPTFAYDHSAGGASANAGAFYVGSTYPAGVPGRALHRRLQPALDPLPDVRRPGPGDRPPFGDRVDRARAGHRRPGHEPLLDAVQRLRAASCAASATSARATRRRSCASRPAPTIGLTPLTVSFDANAVLRPRRAAARLLLGLRRRRDVDRANPIAHLHSPRASYDATLTVTEADRALCERATSACASRSATARRSPTILDARGRRRPTGWATRSRSPAARPRAANPVPGEPAAWELRTLHNQHVHFDTLASRRGAR